MKDLVNRFVKLEKETKELRENCSVHYLANLSKTQRLVCFNEWANFSNELNKLKKELNNYSENGRLLTKINEHLENCDRILCGLIILNL